MTEADEIVARLSDGEKVWAATPLAKRAELLRESIALIDEHAQAWVDIAVDIKGIPVDSPLVGEEWGSGPWATIAGFRALSETVEQMAEGGRPLDGFTFKKAPGDRVAVRVLPHTVYDRLLLTGFTADVWLQPGVTEAQARADAGLGLNDPAHTAGVALVLGAGNIFSIAPLDVIYMLYAHNAVAVLKLNPTTDPLKPIFETVLAPFIDLGVLEVHSGPIALGSDLAYHQDVSMVHITGSEATHDAIVWGMGDERAKNKTAGTPILHKKMWSELGGVSPAIVVPGKWSKADLKYQAMHVATQRLHNSGSNCVASQLLVLSADWDQKDEFLAEVQKAFAEAPYRPAWYPGSGGRVDTARQTHPGCIIEPGGVAERTIVTGLDLQAGEDPAFRDEYFAPVLGVTEIPGVGADFLRRAVELSNANLRGTLGANILIAPRDEKAIGAEFDQLIADLRYGTIAINTWTAIGYLSAFATWGAFPGHTLDDIQSGDGVVHNAGLLDHVERTVVRGPFRPVPPGSKPPWFVNNKTSATTQQRLARLSANPSLSKLPGVFASALRG